MNTNEDSEADKSAKDKRIDRFKDRLNKALGADANKEKGISTSKGVKSQRALCSDLEITIGTMTKTIWKKSKKKPKIKIVIITIKKELNFPPGISVKKFSTIISPPNPLKTNEKSEAPIKIKKTIELIFNVSIQVDSKIL